MYYQSVKEQNKAKGIMKMKLLVCSFTGTIISLEILDTLPQLFKNEFIFPFFSFTDSISQTHK